MYCCYECKKSKNPIKRVKNRYVIACRVKKLSCTVSRVNSSVILQVVYVQMLLYCFSVKVAAKVLLSVGKDNKITKKEQCSQSQNGIRDGTLIDLY